MSEIGTNQYNIETNQYEIGVNAPHPIRSLDATDNHMYICDNVVSDIGSNNEEKRIELVNDTGLVNDIGFDITYSLIKSKYASINKLSVLPLYLLVHLISVIFNAMLDNKYEGPRLSIQMITDLVLRDCHILRQFERLVLAYDDISPIGMCSLLRGENDDVKICSIRYLRLIPDKNIMLKMYIANGQITNSNIVYTDNLFI